MDSLGHVTAPRHQKMRCVQIPLRTKALTPQGLGVLSLGSDWLVIAKYLLPLLTLAEDHLLFQEHCAVPETACIQ